MELSGVAHTFITAGDFAKSRDFYRQLLPFLGMKCVMDNDQYYYCIGGRTAVGIVAPDPAHAGERFVQTRVGLHHLCFRARERAHIDEMHEFLLKMRATIVHGPRDDYFAPGYYSVLFEDPDGVRLEVNHIPGRGLLETKPE
ncbi:MAG TPA: VOC family protein [Rhizomicrobium sp.]